MSATDDRDTVMKDLPVKLTGEDLERMAAHQSETEIKIEGLKDERKDLNKEIGDLEKHRNKLAHCVDSGEEERQVECHWIEDLDHNVRRLIRQDSGDVVDEQTMTAAERQEGLGLDDDAPTDDANDGDDTAV